MNTLIKLEYFFLFLLSLYLYYLLEISAIWFPLLILAPDISMLGYLVNNKFGAITYNCVHFLGLGLTLFIIGDITKILELEVIGIILFSHSSLDRLLGFGLKHTKGFKYTTSGNI